MRHYTEISKWENITSDQWESWIWQIHNSITSLDDLEQMIKLSEKERAGILEATKYFKMSISPHIVSLMNPNDPNDSLRRQFIPSMQELESINSERLYDDVNADNRYCPVKGLIHRYPTKVLILPTSYCGAFCRYCFRRKLVRDIEKNLTENDYREIFKYLRNNKEIEEVILSGGDPLILVDEKLDYILNSLSEIPHIKIVRIHTRIPVTIPYRITTHFLSTLNKYKKIFPIYFIVHIDSIKEFSLQMREALTRLVDNGFPCLASCPLLKGINDDEITLRSLWTELIKLRVKPYYLFQSDPVKGLRHFLVPIDRGLQLMHNLYDRMSGIGIPLYCFNVPDGGGHVLLNYNYLTKIEEGKYLINTFDGRQIEYIEDLNSNHTDSPK